MPLSESGNCVFLLGAGATTHLGHPLMRQFMDRARRRYFELRAAAPRAPILAALCEHFERMFQFQERCLGASVYFERDWENIEDLYTQADLLRQVGNNRVARNEAEVACQSIAWAIWDVYRPRFHSTEELKPISKTVLGPGFADLSPAIITTNYDTSIEQALGGSTSAGPFHPGFMPWAEFRSVGHSVHEAYQSGQPLVLPDRGTPIIKLHGSSGWFGDGRLVMANADLVGHSIESTQNLSEKVGSMQFDPFQETKRLLQGARANSQVGEALAPVIVPPMLGKTAECSAVRDQWEAAIAFLSKARQVWVIGYSFPRTDSFMSRLLIAGLKDNRDLQFVGIVDLASRESWEERLLELFSPSFRSSKTRFLQSSASDFFHKASVWNEEGIEELLAFTDPFRFCETVSRTSR